eukprot:2772286-Rhodomonas_salina.3
MIPLQARHRALGYPARRRHTILRLASRLRVPPTLATVKLCHGDRLRLRPLRLFAVVTVLSRPESESPAPSSSSRGSPQPECPSPATRLKSHGDSDNPTGSPVNVFNRDRSPRHSPR